MELLILFLVVLLLIILASAVVGLAIQILWALFIGAIVGGIANLIVSYFQPIGGPRGCLATALAGIGGSLLATLLFGRQGLLASVVGAIVVVFLWKAATAGRYSGNGWH